MSTTQLPWASKLALAVSVLALVIALGGAGYAATKIGTKQLKANAVTSKKVLDNTLTGADINEATLAQVPTAATLGGRGPSSFLSSAVTVRQAITANVSVDSSVELGVNCLAAERALSGGAGWFLVTEETAVATATISASYPITSGPFTGWRGEGVNTSPAARDFRVYVLCAPA